MVSKTVLVSYIGSLNATGGRAWRDRKTRSAQRSRHSNRGKELKTSRATKKRNLRYTNTTQEGPRYDPFSQSRVGAYHGRKKEIDRVATESRNDSFQHPKLKTR
ncbi:hypothetical protein PLICRDRAFT_41647 [Plicaturopsis crispa FD-325 SS-3]|nr:hypothetical protein PLICRDRAFT_41647 [Plicaturopsis crispa FD-325 SS-3]